MSWPIIWSPEAKDEYAELLTYIENEWGIDSALVLLNETERTIELIREQ